MKMESPSVMTIGGIIYQPTEETEAACTLCSLFRATPPFGGLEDYPSPEATWDEFFRECIGSTQQCRDVLDEGYSVTCRDTMYRTAIHLTARFGRFHNTQILLDAGANPFDTDVMGDTALIYACRSGEQAIVDKF